MIDLETRRRCDNQLTLENNLFTVRLTFYLYKLVYDYVKLLLENESFERKILKTMVPFQAFVIDLYGHEIF